MMRIPIDPRAIELLRARSGLPDDEIEQWLVCHVSSVLKEKFHERFESHVKKCIDGDGGKDEAIGVIGYWGDDEEDE